ncbi:SDR family oxidoreductase [Pusillimonas sp. TS35]|nr:SDR family oxidoreductase [Pusillimonas sp. TS35]
MNTMKNKVALVTGGARGIGAAIVRELALNGASVAFTYQNSTDAAEQLVRQLKNELTNLGTAPESVDIWPVRVDSRNGEHVQRVISDVKARWGKFDILVNNAGVFEAKPIETFSLGEYDEQMAINTKAVFAAMQRAAQTMENGGRIISIGSNLAERVPDPGLSVYAMSKAAVWGLTKAVARELGPRGITVNIIQPGSTDTDMNPADGPHAAPQRLLRAIPDFNRPDEIASLALYLCSDAARAITGASLLVDGGANI